MNEAWIIRGAVVELQDTLSQADFIAACQSVNQLAAKGIHPLILKRLSQITIRIDGNKNHQRPHVHIDYGRNYHAASYAVDTGMRIVGDQTYDREMFDWIARHQANLMKAWNLLQAGKDAMPIVVELRGDD